MSNPFTIFTNHYNLQYFITIKHLSLYQICWIQFFSEFNFEIQYRSGSKAILLDILNRLSGDKLTKVTDIRLVKRYKTLLLSSKLNLQIITELVIQKTIILKLIRIFIFDINQLINQLITEIYQINISITKLIQVIQNPICHS